MKKKHLLILGFLIILLFVINYRFLDNYLTNSFDEKEEVIVERVIDGDTIEAGNESIRLLGINAPERGEKYYEEAKKFLEEQILNKTVLLEYGKERKDKYGRILAYIFLEGESIDIKIVENGFANYYFPSGKDKYYYQFKEAWEKCIKSNKNLCEASDNVCSNCIRISYIGDIVTLKNICSFSCNLEAWTIKGEGRDVFGIPQEMKVNVGKQDTLFLRDKENKLVLWKSY